MRQTVEFAALLAAQSNAIVERSDAWPLPAQQAYWRSVKNRLQHWQTAIEEFRAAIASTRPEAQSAAWEEIEPVLQEIFVTEMVTRVWGGIMAATDRHRQQTDVEPLARRALMGHLEARRQALSLLVNGPHLSLMRLAEIDRLRRRMERWTDLLLGQLVARYGVTEFACEPARASDFGAEHLRERMAHPEQKVWDVVILGLRLATSSQSPQPWPHQEAHTDVIQSILASLPTAAFAVTGPFKSLRQWQFEQASQQPDGPPRDRRTSPPGQVPPLGVPPLASPNSGAQPIRFSKLRRPST